LPRYPQSPRRRGSTYLLQSPSHSIDVLYHTQKSHQLSRLRLGGLCLLDSCASPGCLTKNQTCLPFGSEGCVTSSRKLPPLLILEHAMGSGANTREARGETAMLMVAVA
jgi:hypothetical protein